MCGLGAQDVTYQVGDDDLGLATSWASGRDGSCLVLLGLAGGLLNAANGSVGGTTARSRATVATATAGGGARGLEDVVQGRVELVGAGHVDGGRGWRLVVESG